MKNSERMGIKKNKRKREKKNAKQNKCKIEVKIGTIKSNKEKYFSNGKEGKNRQPLDG